MDHMAAPNGNTPVFLALCQTDMSSRGHPLRQANLRQPHRMQTDRLELVFIWFTTLAGSEPLPYRLRVYPPTTLSVRSAVLGTYGQYVAEKVSDHVPLIVDLELLP
jgi:hypothetical protein